MDCRSIRCESKSEVGIRLYSFISSLYKILNIQPPLKFLSASPRSLPPLSASNQNLINLVFWRNLQDIIIIAADSRVSHPSDILRECSVYVEIVACNNDTVNYFHLGVSIYTIAQ
jgi:hypothetical protein